MKNIIIEPLVTEKTASLINNHNQYVFKVQKECNKIEIKKIIQEIYKVDVTRVNIVKRKGKARKRRQISGTTKARIKAIISLKEGQKIEDIIKLF